MNNIIWCVNIFHLAWPTSPPYLVKVRCSKLLHNDEMYYSHQTIRRRIKLKYGLFSRVINCHDSSAQKFQNSCSKCAPRTLTPALRRRRVSHVSFTPGKRQCCVLETLGRRRLETQNIRPETTCACVACLFHVFISTAIIVRGIGSTVYTKFFERDIGAVILQTCHKRGKLRKDEQTT